MTQQRASRACDPCKRRKIRCNGQKKCQQCTHIGLRCTYAPHPVQRARKERRRGSVIAECRTWSSSGSVPSSIQSHPNPAFFLDFLPSYIEYVYPLSPVVTEAEARDMILHMNDCRDAASFAYIFAAVTLNLGRSDPLQQESTKRDQISILLTRSLEHRRPFHLDSKPGITDLMTSLFTQMCSIGLRRLDLGFLYLREAISLLYMLQADLDDESAPRWQRAYWECFMHERFTALTYQRPTCLTPLSRLPVHDPSLPEHVEDGFNHNIMNFCLVDQEFLHFLMGDRSGVTVDWIEKKQQQLEDTDWHREVSRLPEILQADLIITRHWLRTLTWQIALSNTLLSSASSPGSSLLSLSFPLRLSNQLRQFLRAIPRDIVAIHGSGILEKLFEIANTITDVVLHLHCAPGNETIQRIHDILFLKNFVFSFAGFQALRPAVLTQKFEQIRLKYPEIKEIELLL
ncbi:hypothetical protein N7509_004252 [Penicillium cosmopolitanum]|uniref:Zn(2)-C6 fungal-type domain-containing protein n=1 Tax=Penicillium cosmopolitanum TaxID=1131564 RepID=A0A9X0BC56_9EURO|nr:uncharacterized protein N7509_004252 [Penicillium cosmopolitanum]KAJ5404381.1 hypothetical protein N7509_004252 [Penicillium cosmopolitanum]